MDFSLDIAGAYPEEAACRTWVRDYRFDRRKNTIVLTDSYELSELKGPVALNFLTCGTVTVGKTIEITAFGHTLQMAYDASKFEVTTETIEQTDPRLSSVWGEKLTRISMQVRDPELKDTLRVSFSQAD